jgi:biotin transport system substrate-specific component
MIGAMVIGLIICYTMGASWMGFTLKKTISEAITLGVAPFLPLDLIKIVFVSVIGYQVRSVLLKAKLIII